LWRLNGFGHASAKPLAKKGSNATEAARIDQAIQVSIDRLDSLGVLINNADSS
jgi:hypothetical protein